MPGKVSPTLRVLRAMQDDIGAIRDDLRATNERVDRLENGLVQLSTHVVAMGATLGEVRDLLRDRLDDRGRVERLERIAVVHERRLTRLEKKRSR